MAQTAAKLTHKHHGDFIRRSRGEKIADGVLLAFMILLLCFFLYPLLNMFSISLSDEYAVLRADVTFYPIGFNPQAYDLIFQSQDLWRSIGNSLFVAIVGCALSLAGLSLAAYPLAFAQFYGKKLYSFLILFTMWFQGGIIPQFLTIQQLGLYDSLWALIMNLLMSAYYVVIVKSYFQSIPVSIVESARIDGANDFRILFQLIIPLSKPVLAVIALYYAVGHWNSWFPSMVFIRNTKLYTLQYVLRGILITNSTSVASGDNVLSVQEISFASELVKYCTIVISTLPIMCVYPFLTKYFEKGVMIGAVKG